ncbi:MAG: hypothetical protein KJ852_10775 [Gammaproteobacteria bacterium]|nr:hypothetical protein [Gammaproteobacteria bacterium]MBU0785307.1 hypothetical protein [Gammaproteobacteria bacterium]MBU0815890.1 hypothetical protein [Gammaproteobacteria bacterium]MBU1787429.1 hypothetical protein [Gammaproteobacteria bacterium]
MCTHRKDWAEDTINELNQVLSGTTHPNIEPLQVEGSNAVLYRADISVPGGSVRTTALVWSPILAPLKNQLCYDQTNKSEACQEAGLDKPPYPYQRASLNKALKDVLLDDCFADAIIYQGRSRDAISGQIQKAILTAVSAPGRNAAPADVLKAAATESSPLVLVTESLGSKVAFDAIYKLVTSPNAGVSAAGRQTLDRTAQIFMAANQMPLLALGDQSLDGVASLRKDAAAYQPDPLAALLALKKDRVSIAAVSVPKVVAFSDPNDLLSFILAPAKQTANYAVVDVVVSNDTTYFGALERPDIAHQGYLKNRSVTKLIACGNLDDGACQKP